MEENDVCTACNKGTVVKTTIRRMNGFLVVVGFLLFVPATIGLLFGGIVAFGGGMLANQAKRTPDEIKSELRELAVPEPTITRIFDGTYQPAEEGKSLNQQQLMAVAKAQIAVIGKKAPTETLVGSSLVIVGVSIVVGVVGWLMIRKKWVFLCTQCPVVHPAD
jgi:hypothetical protein